MNYTRKRALLACDFCRHRKRRCSGGNPCSTCKESNADCRYKELPIERVELPSSPSNEALVERLGRIEALLEEQNQRLHNIFPGSSSDPGSVEDGSSSHALRFSPTVTATATATVSQAMTDAGAKYGSSAGFASAFQHHYSPLVHTTATAPFHLVPTGTSASPTLSLAGIPAPSPVDAANVLHPILGHDSTSPHVQQQQQQQQPLAPPPPPSLPQQAPSSSSLSPHPRLSPLPYHPASNTSATSSPYLSVAALAPRPTRPAHLILGRAPSVAGSDTSSSQQQQQHQYQHQQYHYHYHQQQQQQHHQQQPHLQDEQEQFLIPYAHSTATNTLLSSAVMRFYLNYAAQARATTITTTAGTTATSTHPDRFSYPRTYFADVEEARPLPPPLALVYSAGSRSPHVPWPPPVLTSSHPAALDGLANTYFACVHPGAPLFTPAEFYRWSARLYKAGPDDSIETALCLIVWALGSLAAAAPSAGSRDSGSRGGPSPTAAAAAAAAAADSDSSATPATPAPQGERDRMALALFQPALRIVVHHAVWAFGPARLATSQALLLAAAYFAHTGRPLHNARMVHLAGRNLIRLFDEQKRDGLEPELDEKLLRVYWVCFLWECDRAAELDVPRSGVEPLADQMPLPSSVDPDDGDAMICFVAETAVRRLLNRIHSLLYATTITPTTTTTSASASSATGSESTPTDSAGPGHKRKRAETESFAVPGAGLFYDDSGSGGNATAYINATTGGRDAPANLNKMLSISLELNRQLEAWYHAIPDYLRPPLDDENGDSAGATRDEAVKNLGGGGGGPASSSGSGSGTSTTANTPRRPTNPAVQERVKILRVHYYTARHLIHRPFVLHVAWEQQQRQQQQQQQQQHRLWEGSETPPAGYAAPPPAAVLDRCVTCVDSCAAYLNHVLPLLGRRSPYLWSFAQGSLACLLVLLLAEVCPAIRDAVAAAAPAPVPVPVPVIAVVPTTMATTTTTTAPIPRSSPSPSLPAQNSGRRSRGGAAGDPRRRRGGAKTVAAAAAATTEASAAAAAAAAIMTTTTTTTTTTAMPKTTHDLGWLRDRVASQLRRWAVPGSSLEAELRIVESLPVSSGGRWVEARG